MLCILLAPAALVPAATLTGSFTILAPGATVDLSAEGQLDWGHWGLVTEWSYNHRYGMAAQIAGSFVTDAAFSDGPYLLGGGTTVFNWTNGTPSRWGVNTTNGVSIFGDKLQGNAPTGFQLQCPADTTPRRLKVYVATSGARATFSASLSGATTYIDNTLNGATGALSGVYTLEFQSGSPGQTLTVNFNSTDTSGYITLQAATLAGTDAPPTVAITAPADGTVLSAPAKFSITAAAADSDGTVTNLALFNNTAFLGQTGGDSLALALTNQPAGPWNLVAVATDNLGLSVTSFPVKVYVVTNGGTLLGSVAAPPPAVDLTAEGTADWAHWGLSSPVSFDHKSGVLPRIPNVVPLNASTNEFNRYNAYNVNLPTYSWTDGTPTTQALNSSTGIFIYGTNSPPGGFQLSVPATNSLRQLKVYVGLYGAQGRFTAEMSDWSAPPFTDSSLAHTYDSGAAVYTLSFASANPGASLNLTWKPVVLFDANYGNVTWQSVTLSESPPPVLNVVSAPATHSFAFSFYAEAGSNYTVQFADALGSSNWQGLTNLAGTGADVQIVDPGIGASARFYRVWVH